jgi:hypothetical protein
LIAAWMLDPAACATIAIGTPRVATSALIDLNRLLTERGFRRSFPDDPNIVQEKQDEEPASAGAVASGSAPTQHAVRFPKASWDEPDGARDGARPTRQWERTGAAIRIECQTMPPRIQIFTAPPRA